MILALESSSFNVKWNDPSVRIILLLGSSERDMFSAFSLHLDVFCKFMHCRLKNFKHKFYIVNSAMWIDIQALMSVTSFKNKNK